MIEKQGIISFHSYSSQSYASVVLSDSGVTFLGEGKGAIFHLFLNCVLLIDSVA